MGPTLNHVAASLGYVGVPRKCDGCGRDYYGASDLKGLCHDCCDGLAEARKEIAAIEKMKEPK